MFDKELLALPGMRAALAALVLSSLAQAALVIIQLIALARALANLWALEALDGQMPLLALFFACFIVRHAISFIQDELLDRYSLEAASKLRSKLITGTFSESAHLAHQLGTAATATAATEGIDDISRYIRVLPPKLCGLIGFALPVLVALFFIDWVSGIICLVALPVTVLFMVVLGKQAKARSARQFAENQRLSNHFIDTLRGVDAIHSLGAAERIGKSVFESSERLRKATVRTLSVATLSSAVLDLITVFGIAAVAMMLAFRLMDGSIPLYTALTALMLAPEFFGSVRSFSSDFHASLDGKNALASVLGIISSCPSAIDEEPSDTRSPHPWTSDSTLVVRHLSFSYENSEPALDNASFELRGCARVGIVGASGAGKSTLANLIAGFLAPCSGDIVVDGCRTSFCSDAWRRQLHYIPQSPHLFKASLLENVRFYAPNATLEEVERAISIVGLDEVAARLPNGLDTIIGEGGRSLSGGEAQRVALARTLVDERPILVFDEPTAHLDIETELELKQRMLPCMDGRLVFFATHRMHWLKDMDLVLVVENGAIVESGSPSDLLARDSALKRLAIVGREDAA
ncbi:MAG: thiol reductant ABC exporter subunit CydD [Eggerthellaceae bacterium]|nr:thiol reductant ABC exporter subunit CydD [Eggerthellaceae bacterium]